MNNENRPQQVPANADGNLRETHDDESALHSDWSGDESIHESLGDGRPRDAIDENQGDLQDRDDPEGNLLNESGARSPDSLRGYGALTQNGRVSPPVQPSPTPQRLPVAIATIVDDMAKTIVARATLRAKCAIQKAAHRGEHSWLGK